MDMKVVQTLAETKWRCFVNEHPDGNIFHTPEMFQVFAATKGYYPTLWATVNSNNKPLALLLPVEVTLLNGLLRRFTTRAIVYGGVLCAPGPEGQAALALLLKTYQTETKGRVLFTELRNLSDLTPQQLLLNEHHFAYEDHLNYLIDLDQPEESLWQNVKKSCRQHIRTSRNKGTQVEEVTDRSKIITAYQLLQQVYSRSQIPLAASSLFESAFDILAPQGMFTLLLASVDGQYIGTILLLSHNGRILDWYAGSDRAFSAYCPGELLIWHTLQEGRARGFRLFDFGGAGKPDEEYGPREFKAKFGGKLVNYGRNIHIPQPKLLRLSQQGYQIYRRWL